MNTAIQQQHEQIKERIDIAEVIGHFERLKKRGRCYTLKCMFHDENTASASIDPVKGIYKCFGCGVSYDAIGFIRQHLSLSYPDAMKWLGDFYNMPIDESAPRIYNRPAPTLKPKRVATGRQYIPREYFELTLTDYGNNSFCKFLLTMFEPCTVNALIEKYYIATTDYYCGEPDFKGSSDYYTGGVIFWQVDNAGNIRYGKIMGYNPITGKRIKEPASHITTVYKSKIREYKKLHKTPPDWAMLYDQQDSKPMGAFGQHLLSEFPTMPVAVTESEKTAIVASVFFPQFIWLALGGKCFEKYNKDKKINSVPDSVRARMKCLKGRRVFMFPDAGAFGDWQEMAKQLGDITSITVTDLLQTAIDKYNLSAKSDLCDYLTSEAARRELIEAFKADILRKAPRTSSQHCGLWLHYMERGLRRCDRVIAYNELIEAGQLQLVEDKELNPHHYNATILPPQETEYYLQQPNTTIKAA